MTAELSRHRFFSIFRWDRWFPNVPLSLGFALLGIIQVIPALQLVLGANFDAGELSLVETNLAETSLHGIPRGFLGVLLLVTSVGLMIRSRMAWIVTLLITLVMFVLELVPDTRSHKQIFTAYIGILLILLLVGYRRFNRSSLAVATTFAIITGLMLLTYAVGGSYILGKHFTPNIDNFITAFYFSVETMSTVGYGDFVPQTDDARLFVVSIIVLGVSLFATTASTILVPLMNKRIQALLKGGERTMPREKHYIISGDSTLGRNTLKQLKLRNLPVTMILPHTPDEKSQLSHDDIIIGDPTDVDVLNQAELHAAEAILALSEDDSDNAFVIMAVKEMAAKARTVVAVNDAKNFKRVSRVNPDLIIAPEVLGAEILVMALGGETVNPEKILDKLLHFGAPKHSA